jgi:acyl dehydratase
MADAHQFRCEHGPVTSELFVRCATLLNDFNPAHYDLAFATDVGLPGVIGPATLLQGWILADVEATLERPAAQTRSAIPHTVRELDLRLRSPFVVGDTVTIDYLVDGENVHAEARAASAGNEPRVIAQATIRLGAATRSGT